MKLDGKTALVTGGSGSIGGAIARRLASESATVAVSFVGYWEGAMGNLAQIKEEGAQDSLD